MKFDLFAKVEDLVVSIRKLTDVTQGLKAEIPEMQVQLQHAGDTQEVIDHCGRPARNTGTAHSGIACPC